MFHVVVLISPMLSMLFIPRGFGCKGHLRSSLISKSTVSRKVVSKGGGGSILGGLLLNEKSNKEIKDTINGKKAFSEFKSCGIIIKVSTINQNRCGAYAV